MTWKVYLAALIPAALSEPAEQSRTRVIEGIQVYVCYIGSSRQ